VLSVLFGVSDRTTRQIFWSVLKIAYENDMAIPDILDENTDMNKLYESLYHNLDSFHKGIFGSFKDPLGNYIYFD
jgi:hypothetical protein